MVDYVTDASPHKQGKYLPGSHIPIVNEKMIKNLKWNYSFKLEDGMKITFEWIYKELKESNSSTKKFQKSY